MNKPAAALTAPPLSNESQVLRWEAEHAILTARCNEPGALTDEQTDAISEEMAEIEALIAEAPCDTLAVAVVKLRTVVREALVSGCMYRINHELMIDRIVDCLSAANPRPPAPPLLTYGADGWEVTRRW